MASLAETLLLYRLSVDTDDFADLSALWDADKPADAVAWFNTTGRLRLYQRLKPKYDEATRSIKRARQAMAKSRTVVAERKREEEVAREKLFRLARAVA